MVSDMNGEHRDWHTEFGPGFQEGDTTFLENIILKAKHETLFAFKIVDSW